MQYTGTLAVPKIKALAEQADRLIADFRNDARLVLYTAAAYGLAEMAQHVPVLTGTTREVIDNALYEVQTAARRYGGAINLNIDVNTKTYAKRTPDDKPSPMYTDQWYAREYRTKEGAVYHSRQQWAAVAQGEGDEQVFFFNQGNQYYGKYTVGFSINVPHWRLYDERGVVSHGTERGPWHVGEIFNQVAAEELARISPILAQHYAAVMRSGNVQSAAPAINGALL